MSIKYAILRQVSNSFPHLIVFEEKKVFPSEVISTFLCMRRMVNVVCSIDLKMREINGFEINLQFTQENLRIISSRFLSSSRVSVVLQLL